MSTELSAIQSEHSKKFPENIPGLRLAWGFFSEKKKNVNQKKIKIKGFLAVEKTSVLCRSETNQKIQCQHQGSG